MVKVDLQIPGREEIHIQVELDKDQTIRRARVSALGPWSFLQKIAELRANLKGPLKSVPVPIGSDLGDLLIREALLRLRGEWSPPYQEEELCHCRAVPTATVDLAIVAGCHSPRKVSAETSASTACGTCRPNVEAMINYRLGRS